METYINQINQLPVDIRVEVLLADLLENGFSMEDMVVSPVGLFRRNFQNDVGKADMLEMQRASQKKLRLSVNRDGLYDALPEGLFHQPTQGKASNNKREVLREIKRQQERETAARKFFLPLEQEYYRLRVKLVLEERKYLLSGDSVFEGDLFSEFWGFPSFLTQAQIRNLLYLLPIMHRIVGDWEQVRLSFETILESAVEIAMGHPLRHPVSQPTPALGEAKLGVDSVMGGEYEEVYQSVLIRIAPESPEKIKPYLPGGTGGQLIEYLSQYLLPLETDYRIEIKVPAGCRDFSVTEELHSSRLGYTTYL